MTGRNRPEAVHCRGKLIAAKRSLKWLIKAHRPTRRNIEPRHNRTHKQQSLCVEEVVSTIIHPLTFPSSIPFFKY
jgi:hypothetical protein